MTLIKTEETDLAAVKVEESDPTEAIASGIENSEQPTRSRKRRRRARLTRKPKRAWHPWNLLPSERPQYIPEGEALLDDLYESMDASDRHAITVMVLQDREEALEKRLARLEANRLAWQEKNRMRRDGIELVHLGPGDDGAIATRTRGRKEDSYPNTRSRAARSKGRSKRVAQRSGMEAVIGVRKTRM